MTGATAQPRRDLGYEHVLVPGDGGATLLLLHATGGDEHQLVELGRRLAPGVTLLSPRGKELENGVTRRFFRRHSPTELDIPDLLARTDEMADFVAAAAAAYGLDAGPHRRARLLERREHRREPPAAPAGDPPGRRPAAADAPVRARRGAAPGGRRASWSPPAPATPSSRQSSPSGSRGSLRLRGPRSTYRVADAGHELAPSDLADAAAWLARLTDEPAATGAGDPQAGTPPADRA